MIKHLPILSFVLLVTTRMVLVSGQTPDKTVPPKPTAAGIQGIEGRWEGVLVHPAAKLRLVLKVSRGADGSLKAIMDSLDQNANDLPVDSIVFQNGTLHFEMKAIYVFYDATCPSTLISLRLSLSLM